MPDNSTAAQPRGQDLLQAADELGGDLLGGAGEEGMGEGLGERGGYGSGFFFFGGVNLTSKSRKTKREYS